MKHSKLFLLGCFALLCSGAIWVASLTLDSIPNEAATGKVKEVLASWETALETAVTAETTLSGNLVTTQATLTALSGNLVTTQGTLTALSGNLASTQATINTLSGNLVTTQALVYAYYATNGLVFTKGSDGVTTNVLMTITGTNVIFTSPGIWTNTMAIQ